MPAAVLVGSKLGRCIGARFSLQPTLVPYDLGPGVGRDERIGDSHNPRGGRPPRFTFSRKYIPSSFSPSGSWKNTA